MIFPGYIGWADRWPAFDIQRRHPILVVKDLGDCTFSCLPISHSVELFDFGGSVELRHDLFQTAYPPLRDKCFLGVRVEGLPATVDCVFSGTLITNHGDLIQTSAWRALSLEDWNKLRLLIRVAARGV